MKQKIASGAPRVAVLSYGLLGCLLAGGSLEAQVQFSAIAAGDASSESAIVWTRALDPAVPAGTQIMAQVSTDPAFATIEARASGTPTAATDYTIKFEVPGLTAGTRYYYRFLGPAHETSITGHI